MKTFKDFKVLVVNDRPDVLTALRMSFEHLGFEVHTASDGYEGIRKAKTQVFDLHVLDIDLPGMDGFELGRKMKNTPGILEVPMIYISGKHGKKDRVTALEIGAVDYLVKPFSLEDLRKCLGKIFEETV
jgi:DNA-binding response OmpR family regulator